MTTSDSAKRARESLSPAFSAPMMSAASLGLKFGERKRELVAHLERFLLSFFDLADLGLLSEVSHDAKRAVQRFIARAQRLVILQHANVIDAALGLRMLSQPDVATGRLQSLRMDILSPPPNTMPPAQIIRLTELVASAITNHKASFAQLEGRRQLTYKEMFALASCPNLTTFEITNKLVACARQRSDLLERLASTECRLRDFTVDLDVPDRLNNVVSTIFRNGNLVLCDLACLFGLCAGLMVRCFCRSFRATSPGLSPQSPLRCTQRRERAAAQVAHC